MNLDKIKKIFNKKVTYNKLDNSEAGTSVEEFISEQKKELLKQILNKNHLDEDTQKELRDHITKNIIEANNNKDLEIVLYLKKKLHLFAQFIDLLEQQSETEYYLKNPKLAMKNTGVLNKALQQINLQKEHCVTEYNKTKQKFTRPDLIDTGPHLTIDGLIDN